MCSFVMLNKECEPSSDGSTLEPLWIVLGVLPVIFVVIAVAVYILRAKKKPATDNVDAQEFCQSCSQQDAICRDLLVLLVQLCNEC